MVIERGSGGAPGGAAGSIIKTGSVTKAVAAAGNYAAEDILSSDAAVGTAWTFSAVLGGNGRGGYITKATVSTETTGLTQRMRLFIYNAATTSETNDNAANDAVLNADISQYQGYIDFPALQDVGGNSEAVVTPSTSGNLPLWVQGASAADDLICLLVTRDAITDEVATNEYTIKLSVEAY